MFPDAGQPAYRQLGRGHLAAREWRSGRSWLPAVHAAGVMHCDVKPEHLLLARVGD
jgi:hypothetical protein